MGRKHHSRNHAKHKTHEHDPVTDNLISIFSHTSSKNNKHTFSILTDSPDENADYGMYGELDPDAFNSGFGLEEYLSGAYIPGAPMDDETADELVAQYLTRKIFEDFTKSTKATQRQAPRFSEIEKYTKYSTTKKQAQKGKNKMAKVMIIKNRPHLFIVPSIYEKMESLIFGAEHDEIAWHGFVRRLGQPERMIFELYDIIVYPQTVSDATTTSDEEEYAKWYINDVMSRDDFENFKFHGHSHVNFGCTPSATDNKFRNDILTNITAEHDDYYIFMIMNKKDEYTIQLFYPKDNIVFEGSEKASDIFIHRCSYEDYENSILWAATEIKNNIKTPKAAYNGYSDSTYSAGKHWDPNTKTWVENKSSTSSTDEWIKKYGGSKEYGYGPREIYFTEWGYRANGQWHQFTEEEKTKYKKNKYTVEAEIKAAFYKACNEADAATSANDAATSAVASDTQAPVLVKADGKTPLTNTKPAKVIATTTQGGDSKWKEQNSMGQKENPSTDLTPLQQHMMDLDRD